MGLQAPTHTRIVGVDNRARSRVATVRTLLLAGLAMVSILIPDGTTNFAVSCIGLTLSLVLQFVHLPNFFRLSMVWTAAYIYVIGLEGYFDGESIARSLTSVQFDEAAQFMNAANALLLFGHSLVFREPDGNRPRPPAPLFPTPRAQMSSAVLFMGAITTYYVALSIPYALSILAVGRVGTDQGGSSLGSDATTAILGGLLSSAGLSAPVMWLYFFVVTRRRHPLYGILPALPIFLLQVAIGTRFMLLISLLGSAILYLSQFPLRGRSLRWMGIIGAIAFMAASIMRQVRTFGVDAIESFRPIDLLNPGDYEGCTRVLTQTIDYFHTHEHFHGRSLASILLFWIPRAFWANKPTLFGHWFPREYGDARGYSAGHSASGGFAADMYVDFGFTGGLIACFLAGLLFGSLERKVDDLIVERSPMMVMACCCYGATFFAVRSPDTTFILMSGVTAMTLLFRYALKRDAFQPKIL